MTKSELVSQSNEISMTQKKSGFIKKAKRWSEPIGLLLLLFAFGWQCFEESSSQMKTECILLETNEKLNAIWGGVYDEALHSDRYHGEAATIVNYDAVNQSIKDWGQIQRELEDVSKQGEFFFWMRVLLYCIGSILIILSKLPLKFPLDAKQ